MIDDDNVGLLDVAARYDRLDTDRYTWLDRARQCAQLTLPTLIPPLGHTKTTKYITPWQGIGARGVNVLAAKLLLAVLPPNSPCFRMVVDDFTKDKIAGDPSMTSAVEQGFAKIERAVNAEIEGSGLRAPTFLALKHLIVGGNAFEYLPQEGGARVFGLDSYVCLRDPKGNVMEVITKETINPEIDEKGFLDKIEDQAEGEPDDSKSKRDRRNDVDSLTEEIDLYTRFYRDNKQWKMYQFAKGKAIPETDGSWPIDKPPFMVLRWNHVDGENYGRSYVEEYLGDLISLEGLTKAIVEAAAVASKIVYLVSPNGLTRAEDLSEAENGDYIAGHKDDVHALQSEKQADLQIAYKAVEAITTRLSYAFMMTSAIQRNGERVTAEEIRIMASDLEDTLGGVYSVLSQELQLPLVIRVMDRMTRQKRLPELPKGIVRPVIVTGLEALGRGHDLTTLMQFGQFLQQLGPAAQQIVNYNELATRVATAMMIDPAGLIKTAQDMQQEQQQAQQAQQGQQMSDMAGKAAPAIVKALSDHSLASMQAQGGQPSNSGPPQTQGQN